MHCLTNLGMKVQIHILFQNDENEQIPLTTAVCPNNLNHFSHLIILVIWNGG